MRYVMNFISCLFLIIRVALTPLAILTNSTLAFSEVKKYNPKDLQTAGKSSEYFIYRSPVHSKVLQHSHATSDQSNLVFIRMYKGHGLNLIEAPIEHCVIVHGYGVDKTILDMFSKDTFQYSLMHMTFPLFVKSYYSDELPKELLQVCGSVAVILQESVSSTILEMTERVEMLLERAFCKNGSCALIGHSKGGAVISSIARRCMQTTSLAGERSCKHVSKFYSAMGVNLGALGPVIAYGAYRMDHKKARHDTAIAYSQKLTHYLGFLMPIYEKYKPEETNPVWADLGPVSPVDNGMPLALANQVRLEQKGWLTGKYAASGPKHHYTGFLTRDRNFEGCFGVQKSNVLNFSTCYVFNHVLAALHRKDLVKAYFFGLQELKKEEFLVPNDAAADLLDQYSWQDYQHSDGLADYKGALGLCVQGGSAISDCHELPINHLAGAGGSDMARYEILKHLKNG